MSGLSQASSPQHVASLLTRAVEALQRGNPAAAERPARQALEAAPLNPDCHLVLATVCHNLNRLEDAKRHYAESWKLKPDNARTLINLGMLQLNAAEGADAVINLEKAVKLDAKAVDGRHYLARAYALTGRFDKAISEFAIVERALPENLEVLTGYARALRDANRITEAVAILRRAVALGPDDESLHRNLGADLAILGDFDGAEAALRESIRLRPEQTTSFYQLSAIRRLTDADTEILVRLLQDIEDMPNDQRAALLFAIGASFERKGEFLQAFQAFREANTVRNQENTYDRDAVGEYYEQLTLASEGSLAAEWPNGHESELPIFIVGMPRSGTTLVEQILAGHRSVLPGGEQKTMKDGVVEAMKTDARFTPEVGALNAGQLRQLAQVYLDQLPEGSNEVTRVTDKLPGNVDYLPLIARMFPKARFILCRRHPMDVAWSIFKHSFADKMNYANDLANIAHMANQVFAFMDHWMGEFPERSLEVCYEHLTSDFEPGARRIVEFAGLPWEDSCMDTHKVERGVRTASLWQVRQPIFTSSVGFWKNYAEHLEDTQATLAEHIANYEARLRA